MRDLTERVRSVAEERAEYRASKAAAIPKDESLRLIKELQRQMKDAASRLEFEKAALLRDQIIELRRYLEDESLPEWERIRQWEERRRTPGRGSRA